jgi:L-fuculose-phosphate aldolase
LTTPEPVDYAGHMGELLLADLRARICDLGRRMVADRLVVGTSGNISARDGDLVAVTPTGVEYARLVPASIAVLDLASGRQIDGDLAPTSEVPLHLGLYREGGERDGDDRDGDDRDGDDRDGDDRDGGDRDGDVRRAIVHTHAPYATAVGLLVTELPPIHYLLAMFGGSVRVARYATFGTQDLADAARAALADRHGCLLANHGAVTVGATLEGAYERAVQLEWLCQVWLAARSAGAPATLHPDELARVGELMRGYGPTGTPPPP